MAENSVDNNRLEVVMNRFIHVDSLMENLEEILCQMLKRFGTVANLIETFKEKLSLLRRFLRYMHRRCLESDEFTGLLSYIEAVVVKGARSAIATSLFIGKDDRMARETVRSICDVEKMINPSNLPSFQRVKNKNVIQALTLAIRKLKGKTNLASPEFREIYIGLLKTQIVTASQSYEIVVGFLDFTDGKLKELVHCDSALVIRGLHQISVLMGELLFQRAFLCDMGISYSKEEKFRDIMKNVEAVANKSGCFLFLFYHNNQMENNNNNNNSLKPAEMDVVLANLLEDSKLLREKIKEKYFKIPKVSGSEIPRTDDLRGFSIFLKEVVEKNRLEDEAKAVQEELMFLTDFLKDSEKKIIEGDKLYDLLKHIELVANKAGCIIYKFYAKKLEEQTNLALSELPEDDVMLIKTEIRKSYFKVLKSLDSQIFSRSDELLGGSLDLLLGNLKEIQICKPDLIFAAKDQIKRVEEELKILIPFLRVATDQLTKHKESKHLLARISDAAHETEYVIDLLVVREGPVSYLTCWLSDVIEELKVINAVMAKISDQKMYDSIGFLEVVETTNSIPAQVQTLMPDEVFVGFDDEAAKIIERLIGGSMRQDIIPIIGMPGLGKTTMAKKVYVDPSIVHHFYIRAWCCVSQVYEKKEMLLSILSSVVEVTDKIRKLKENDLAQKLYKNLKGKRYLIVVDDIWTIDPWIDLKRSFPDDNNKSRIIFTSRYKHVAFEAKHDCAPHFLPLLSKEDSWNLLEKRVFRKESCPHDLLQIGKHIAEKCQGLPLSIVVIAGILRRADKNRYRWEKLVASLGSQIAEDSNQCMETLALSYKHLPDHLKPCFLYLGAFPEDRDIPVSKLLRLWTAEGFVHPIEHKNLEEVAEDYLMDLINRSLVLVSKRRSNGRVKSCQIHDLLREFAIRKAEEQNFLHLINGSYSGLPLQYSHSRLSICIAGDQLVDSLPSTGSKIRSFLFFPNNNRSWCQRFGFTLISQNFKLLRVLDLESIEICEFLPHGMLHLRYLSVYTTDDNFPPSIGDLWNLETFIFKKYVISGIREVELPSDVSKLVKLRHLRVRRDAFIDMSVWSAPLTHLQTLSSVRWRNITVQKIVRYIPNLKKLGIVISDSDFPYCGEWVSIPFPEFNDLHCLESLSVDIRGQFRFASAFSFPSTLKRLTLLEFQQPWKEMSAIGRLPNLEVLKVLTHAFKGRKWNTNDGEFGKLKYLKLYNLDIEEWNTMSDHFPSLERLVLEKCWRLEEIPSGFGDSLTLKTIEVNWCNRSTADSAKKIQEHMEEMGNEELNVIV